MQRSNIVSNAKNDEVIGTAAVLVLLSPVCFAVKAFFFQVITWNLGVVGLADALGSNVSKISYWTAVGALFVYGMIRNLFGQSTATNEAVAEAVKSATS